MDIAFSSKRTAENGFYWCVSVIIIGFRRFFDVSTSPWITRNIFHKNNTRVIYKIILRLLRLPADRSDEPKRYILYHMSTPWIY